MSSPQVFQIAATEERNGIIISTVRLVASSTLAYPDTGCCTPDAPKEIATEQNAIFFEPVLIVSHAPTGKNKLKVLSPSDSS